MNDEARLEALAKRLGNEAAARIDVNATARKVVERLREQPVRRRTWIEVHFLRIAAAVVILVGGGLAVQQLLPDTDLPAHGNHLVADDLGDLSNDQLKDVLSRFDEIVGTPVVHDSTDLHELDAQQLRDVLRSLEG